MYAQGHGIARKNTRHDKKGRLEMEHCPFSCLLPSQVKRVSGGNQD